MLAARVCGRTSALVSRSRLACGRVQTSRFSTGRTLQEAKTASGEPQSKSSGSLHWVLERGLSVALLGLFPAAFLVPSKSIDYAIGVVLPVHAYLGMQAAINDYLPNRKMPVAYGLAINSARLASVGMLYGLYKLNSQDVGITETLKKLWRLH